MDLKEYKNLWVFIEQENGEPKNVGLELLNEAKRLMMDVCLKRLYFYPLV